MAKKVVATLKDPTKDKKFVKVVRAAKTKNGAYSFKEEFVAAEDAKAYFQGK